MAIALVTGQVASNSAAGTGSLNVVLPNNPATGNFVVVCISLSANVTVTVKDGFPNTYALATGSPFLPSDATLAAIYILPNITNGNKTITVTLTPNAAISVHAAEFSGVMTSSPQETHNEVDAIGSSSTAITTPSTTTTIDGDLLIGFGVGYGSTGVTAANSPWTGISTVQVGNYAEYYIQPTHGAQAIDFTQSPASGWVGMVAAFKAAAGGPLFIPPRRRIRTYSIPLQIYR
jgi:hypothetical protein